MKKSWLTLALAVSAAAALTACSGGSTETTAAQTTAAAADTTAAADADSAAEASDAGEEAAEDTAAASGELEKLVVGASPAPHAEILEAAREVLASKGYDLEIVEYTDYVIPNNALDSGDLDANYFQHKPYLDSFNEQNGTDLVSAGAIHYEPFGIYAGKTASLDALPDGATVLVPNDITNEARALLLLEAQGLLTLKEDAGLEATPTDIVDNPKNLEFVELEAALLPRSLPDEDIAVINGNYAIEAGLKMSDAMAVDASDSLAATTSGNVVEVRAEDAESDKTKALIEALTSPEVKEFIETTYEGAVVPLF